MTSANLHYILFTTFNVDFQYPVSSKLSGSFGDEKGGAIDTLNVTILCDIALCCPYVNRCFGG
jgi:hypothetical protein